MIEKKRGVIVNISSGAGQMAAPMLVVYCATKVTLRTTHVALSPCRLHAPCFSVCNVLYSHMQAHSNVNTGLIPRLHPAFQCATLKAGRSLGMRLVLIMEWACVNEVYIWGMTCMCSYHGSYGHFEMQPVQYVSLVDQTYLMLISCTDIHCIQRLIDFMDKRTRPTPLWTIFFSLKFCTTIMGFQCQPTLQWL